VTLGNGGKQIAVTNKTAGISLATTLLIAIMKSLSTVGTASKGIRPEINKTLNGQQHIAGGDLRGGRTSLIVCGFPTQSCHRPVRGLDASTFMMSQLG
jgi:hypothetical protein